MRYYFHARRRTTYRYTSSRLTSRRVSPLTRDLLSSVVSVREYGRNSDASNDREDPSVLRVKDVNLRTSENARDHHTSDYEDLGGHLAVRRGQPFNLTFQFSKQYDQAKDDIRFVFEFGEKPLQTKGTRISMILSDKDEPGKWGAKLMEEKEKTATIKIWTPPECLVGKWSLAVEVIKKGSAKNTVYRYKHDIDIYLLYNPWCKDDAVYFPEEELLEEYILNETGKIYIGNKNQLYGKPWNFGQFEENILECALLLLDNSDMSDHARGDPIKTVRKLSALVNAQDDNGVLVGRWDGRYIGGTAPTAWMGSVKILQEYKRTQSSVSYGQCWVFSGVLTTLCRTLGIPARSVTNFSSAHDTDGSITIDNHWSAEGDPIPGVMDSSDSVWNFHVWNDVWMARPDLPSGYGGWQAVDATPQETSEGVYRCGPCSIVALQRGEVTLPYDGQFIFAEINADRVNWVQQPDGSFKRAEIDKNSVGKYISTKLPDRKERGKATFNCDDVDREDVTLQYKHKEDSAEERAAVIKANITGAKPRFDTDIYQSEGTKDVKFELVPKEKILYGKNYTVVLKATNTGEDIRTLDGCISTSSVYYTGVTHELIKRRKFQNVKLKPKQSTDITLDVGFEDYANCIAEQCHLKMYCMCHVSETNQVYNGQDDFRLLKPDIKIKVLSEPKVGKETKINISFKNPLQVPLMRCELVVEGPGLQNPLQIRTKKIVEKDSNFDYTLTLVPRKAGKRQLLVNVQCDEIVDITGSAEIVVKAS